MLRLYANVVKRLRKKQVILNSVYVYNEMNVDLPYVDERITTQSFTHARTNENFICKIHRGFPIEQHAIQ